MSYIVNIDGNIGSGKTSVLKYLERQGYPVLYEPFEKNEFLPLYYKDLKRYAYSVQTYFLSLRKKQYNTAALIDEPVVFVERTVYTDRFIFAKMLADDGVMSDVEWKAYCSHWDICKTHIPDLSIVMSVTPKTCLERIKKRDREMETTVPLEYLEKLDAYYRDNYKDLGIVGIKKWFNDWTIPEVAESIKMLVDEQRERGKL